MLVLDRAAPARRPAPAGRRVGARRRCWSGPGSATCSATCSGSAPASVALVGGVAARACWSLPYLWSLWQARRVTARLDAALGTGARRRRRGARGLEPPPAPGAARRPAAGRRAGGRAAARARRGAPGRAVPARRCSPRPACATSASSCSTTGRPTARPRSYAGWPAPTRGCGCSTGAAAAGRLVGQAVGLRPARRRPPPTTRRARLRRRRRGARAARGRRVGRPAAVGRARPGVALPAAAGGDRRPSGWCSRCCSGPG